MVKQLSIVGRIDEIEDFINPDALESYLQDVNECGAPPDVAYPPALIEELKESMFTPLGLLGVYMVTGIEGKHYDGYVPGKRLADSGWVDDPSNDAPWPLTVTPNMAAIDIMIAVSKSEANGYPHVNHVWFESLDIDTEARTIQFGMGS